MIDGLRWGRSTWSELAAEVRELRAENERLRQAVNRVEAICREYANDDTLTTRGEVVEDFRAAVEGAAPKGDQQQ